MTAIIGESGSDKSNLLLYIARLDKPISGNIFIHILYGKID